MITTVLGDINENQMGITSSHEHILIDMRNCVKISGNERECFYDKVAVENRCEVFSDPYAILDNALLDDVEDAVEELKYFKTWGGSTIVDCTPDEIGRNPSALKEISQKTGVNIIMGCGHYYHMAHFPSVKTASVENLAEEMFNDITIGVKNTGIKAGVIGEIGTSAIVTEDEKKVLRAAGIVGSKTGKGIHIHTDLYTENGFDIIKILEKEGVKPEKICIDHIDVLIRPDYVYKLLEKGVYIEFDNFGKEFYVSKTKRFAYDLERVEFLKDILDKGYANHVLICNDICLKTMWKKYGGNGYAHILRTVKDMLLESGIDENKYVSILTDNIRNFLN